MITSEEPTSKRGAADLVNFAANAELFHTPEGRSYATFLTGGHFETWEIGSPRFRNWLDRKFYAKFSKNAAQYAMDSALSVLRGKSLWEGKCLRVYTRLAEVDDAIWLDLMDENWNVIKITGEGWSLVGSKTPLPVKFRRTTGGRPLPVPERGGSIDLLRDVCNVKSDTSWRLIVSWLVGCMNPSGPYPVLILNGQQGSAKSVMSRFLRSVIDPLEAPLRSQPRTDQELMIWAVNSWIICLNNISHISQAQSDSLARLATGGGFSARELYTDASEFILDACRPIIMNGIDDFVVAPDLLDRSIWVTLPPIGKYIQERTLNDQFHDRHPAVLGGLCEAAVEALRNRSVVPADLPRMADFAAWVDGARLALGWDEGTFSKLYKQNRLVTRALGLGAEPIVEPLMKLIVSSYVWGPNTATELLTELNMRSTLAERRSPGWPSNSMQLGNALRRSAPVLSDLGISIKFQRGSKARMIALRFDPSKAVEIPLDEDEPI